MKDFKNLGAKKIKCMLTETIEGDILIEYSNFNMFKEKYIDVIEVYNPSQQQKEHIINLLSKSLNVDNDLINSEIKDMEILNLLKELTNINFSNIDDNEDLIKDILDNPSDLLLRTKMEIDKICTSIFYMWYDNVKEFGKTPKEIREAILLSKQGNNSISKEQKEKEDKIKALQEQLKQLQGE